MSHRPKCCKNIKTNEAIKKQLKPSGKQIKPLKAIKKAHRVVIYRARYQCRVKLVLIQESLRVDVLIWKEKLFQDLQQKKVITNLLCKA